VSLVLRPRFFIGVCFYASNLGVENQVAESFGLLKSHPKLFSTQIFGTEATLGGVFEFHLLS